MQNAEGVQNAECRVQSYGSFSNFVRKAYLNRFNYFATFTYDDRKHTEESFRKKLVVYLLYSKWNSVLLTIEVVMVVVLSVR